MDLTGYRTLVFDCDGVILDSNHVKTTAFYNAALPYGIDKAEALVSYHKLHGGVSRYRKFETFLRDIAQRPPTETALYDLLQRYAAEVREGLMRCSMAPGLATLREETSEARWMVVSGGDEAELRDIFSAREIDVWFDAGIFGSPDDKDTILAREKHGGNLRLPAVFLGDSRYDYEAAERAGLDFIFVSAWSEFSDWQAVFSDKKVTIVDMIR